MSELTLRSTKTDTPKPSGIVAAITECWLIGWDNGLLCAVCYLPFDTRTRTNTAID
jgi:hypothetical protein